MDQQTMAETLITRAPPFWKFWADLPEIQKRDLDEDLLRIEQYYRARGFYHAKAEYEIVHEEPEKCTITQNTETDADDFTNKKGGGCVISVAFHISEGPPVRIRQIEWTFPEARNGVRVGMFTDRIPLKAGEVFTTADYDTAKLTIRKILGKRGYPFAAVKGRVRIDLAQNTAAVTFDVNPGDLHYFGEVRISGNGGFVEETIIHRALLFEKGQKYNAAKLDESRRNLFELNVFKTAVIEPEKPEKGTDTVPIHIKVKPRKSQSVELGAGYGTEDGIRLRGGWRYQNVTGHADRFSLTAKRSDLIENIQAEYLWPYFFTKDNTFKLESGYESEDAEFYTLREIFATGSIRHRAPHHWYITPLYSLMLSRPDNISQTIPDAEAIEEENIDYRISAVKLAADRIDVKDELNPYKGTIAHLSVEGASSVLGSEIDYYKPSLEYKIYLPVVDRVTFAGRFRMRTIKAVENTEQIPIFLRLFLGGSKTVRGYGYQQLGIYDKDDLLAGIGGQSSFCGNLELRFPVYKRFYGVAFVDMGLLNASPFRYDFSQMRYSCGLGGRFNTVIGPVQFDIGYKINPPKGSAIESESAETDRWQFHLNIGHAF